MLTQVIASVWGVPEERVDFYYHYTINIISPY
jgi:hypothetical protein